MANQIAIFCQTNPDGTRHTADVADHINKYWDPRLRLQLIDAARNDSGEGMHALVRDALTHIRLPATKANA